MRIRKTYKELLKRLQLATSKGPLSAEDPEGSGSCKWFVVQSVV